MYHYHLLLGSNLGNRLAYLDDAMHRLYNTGNLLDFSSVYETDSWGIEDQPAFLNMVLVIESHMDPESYLTHILAIEKEIGRVRAAKWDERTIDIDILYAQNLVLNTTSLTIPHPHIAERKFVLVPLNEITPDFLHPVLHLTNRQLLNRCTDKLEVNLYLHKSDYRHPYANPLS